MITKKDQMVNYHRERGLVLWAILLGVSGGMLLGLLSLFFEPDWFGAGRYGTHPIPLGAQMPAPCPTAREPNAPSQKSSEGQATLERWSARDLPDWRAQGKVTAPRILLAKLHAGVDIEEVNRYLRAARPVRGTGSTWKFHYGDYDFTMVTLSTLLYMFGDRPDRLYPDTLEHLLHRLLIMEGGAPLVTVPRTFGLILDTENHHLMTEGSRYLKNQWLATYGTEEQRADPRYDNRENGLEAWLVAYLEEMLHEGVYEFNSRPYIGFTMQALLNLEAYPDSVRIRQLSRYLLDIINMQYALGSLDLRRYPPFRRQYKQARKTALGADPHTAFMRVWADMSEASDVAAVKPGSYQEFVLLAELLPYRPPEDVRAWTVAKPEHYFVQYGRGTTACPELYSGGPGYLLGAGGVNRGWRSHIVAKPITLLLSDGETDAARCFQIPGHGPWRTWNSTGVYRRFAVANAPVSVPEQYEALVETGGWRIFLGAAATSPVIAAYSGDRLGILAIFPEP
ncbi:MAG TPA: hypothetical protein ENN65_00770, partial [Candidatus Hydrogenedentes bacterium]|nr:hypothetical protein [Candidatus Hydrogenedentota bacterium]